ncbi:hypothetical protein ACO2Q3_02545 [Caulobacter sp. KR2-114]|uniref:hypothetical protein n=1 Tax=Caulobacter sp. KR2-114 TaxID=3400912 RepID=UPI003C0E505C
MSSALPPPEPCPIVRPASGGGPLAPTERPTPLSYRSGGARLRRYLAYAAARPDDGAAGSAPPEDPAPTRTAEEARRLYKWGGQFSAVLTEMRGRFDGDLDQYLIYMVFMLAEHGQARAAAQVSAAPARGLNAFSIAEITGIPRETVRRKLAALTARGEVRRSEDGLYHVGPAASLDGFFHDLSRLA